MTLCAGVCYLPKAEGDNSCSDYQLFYYYNAYERNCGAFYWRGCGGNQNRFSTWDECNQRSVVEVFRDENDAFREVSVCLES